MCVCVCVCVRICFELAKIGLDLIEPNNQYIYIYIYIHIYESDDTHRYNNLIRFI